MKILITGPQGSGKTTQAEIIAQRLKANFFSLGEKLRELMKKDDTWGQVLRKTSGEGKLAPNDLAAKVVREYMEGPLAVSGVVVDGYPRTMEQVELYEPDYDKVIYLEVPEDVVLARLVARGREDDTLDKIKSRLGWYYEQTEPLLDYYQRKGKLVVVNGNQPIEQVTLEIERKLKEATDYEKKEAYI